MGQAGSRDAGIPPDRRRSRLSTRLSSSLSPIRSDRDNTDQGSRSSNAASRRLSSLTSFSSFSRSLTSSVEDAHPTASGSHNELATRRASRLTRARSALSSFPNLLSRHSLSSSSRPATPARRFTRPSSPLTTSTPLAAPADRPFPLQPNDMAMDLPDVDDLTTELEAVSGYGRNATRQHTGHLRDRVTTLDHSLRSMTSSLRRRHSPPAPRHGGDDQAAMLSRLLSVAAAATAATLMGVDHRTFRSNRAPAYGDEDGSFARFLQSLESGRIASALRQTGNEDRSGNGSDDDQPLNFFRMFRFRSSTLNPRRINARQGMQNGESFQDGGSLGSAGTDEENEQQSRLIPVIIVGIRSITPGNSISGDNSMPPFLEALSNFEDVPASPNDAQRDSLPRQPQNGTSFSHRRRASMGTLDNERQRHPRTSDRSRPSTTAPESPTEAWPLPMPAPSSIPTPTAAPTPARVGSRSTGDLGSATAMHGLSSPSRTPSLTTPSRHSSFLGRNAGASRESSSEEPQTNRRTARQRRMSESDFTRFGSGSSRRNGVVGPDRPEEGSSRSWIIYVLGGTYPENHPILNTPSLYSDSPTYEDMLLLSALLGPAKPPVASEADVAAAPGLYTVVQSSDGLAALLADDAADTDGDCPTRVPLTDEQKCLVCLCDFEEGEKARRLIKCGHVFHRECIDMWLTTGRNSCPLCRAQGVEETPKEESDTETPQAEAGTAF